MLSPRNRELLGLLPSALLVIAGFTAIFIQAENNTPGASTNFTLNHASSVSLTYGALFLGLCLAGHLVIRYALPFADPYLFPLTAVLAKIAIVVFLASYLRDNRQILVTAGRRVLGLTIPPMKQFGPMLIVWGAAMATLLITRELGTSLMFYGAFLALLYVATGRFSFPFIGLVLFAIGAWFVAGHVSHVHARVLAWEHPFDPHLYNTPVGGSYQLAQSLFAQADGGLLGTGFDQSLLRLPHQHGSILPVPESDTIYAVFVNELGLAGAVGLLLTYLLLVARGLKTAALARDSFSKLLCTGLAFVLAMQVFVIVGGVTRVIPLTGVTLPLVAYGGSSVVMNFVLLALLLVVSDRARRPYAPSVPRR